MMSSWTTLKDLLVGKVRTNLPHDVVLDHIKGRTSTKNTYNWIPGSPQDDYEGAPSSGLLHGPRRPRRGAARRRIFEAHFAHKLDLK